MTTPEILAFRRKTIDVDAYEFPLPPTAVTDLSVLHPLSAVPSLHRPSMWDDLRQCLYEARMLIEKRHRCLRFSKWHRRQCGKCCV